MSSKITITNNDGSFEIDPAQYIGMTMEDVLVLLSQKAITTIGDFVHKNHKHSKEQWLNLFNHFVTKDILLHSYHNLGLNPCTRAIDSYMIGPCMVNDIPVRKNLESIIYGSWCQQILDKNGRLPTKSCVPIVSLVKSSFDGETGNNWSHPLLQRVSHIDWGNMPDGVVLAGGVVAGMLLGRKPEDIDAFEDLDFWITGPTPHARKAATRKCFEWLGKEYIYTRREACITLIHKTNPNCPNIQVIYTDFIHPAQLVSSFDLPMVRCYIDKSGQVFGTVELCCGIVSGEFIIDYSEMSIFRWSKLYRYSGMTYHIINCPDTKDYIFTSDNHPGDTLQPENIRGWVKTEYGFKITIPENMSIHDRRSLCYMSFDSMDEVYEKYYYYIPSLSERRNLHLAKKVLSADRSSPVWDELVLFQCGWREHCNQQMVAQELETEAVSSSNWDTKKLRSQNDQSKSKTIYREARWNMQVKPYIEMTDYSEKHLEQWNLLWDNLSFSDYTHNIVLCINKSISRLMQFLPPRLLIPDATIVINDTQSGLDMTRNEYRFNLEMPRSSPLWEFIERAYRCIIYMIVQKKESSDGYRDIKIGNKVSCQSSDDDWFQVAKLFIDSTVIKTKIPIQGKFTKNTISKVMKVDIMLDFRNIVLTDKLSVTPYFELQSPIKYMSEKISIDQYIWPSIYHEPADTSFTRETRPKYLARLNVEAASST